MIRVSVLLAVSFGLLAAAFSVRAQPSPAGPVEVTVLAESNWDRFAPAGKEVDAIYGDIVLRNQHLIAVIARPLATRHANMTVRDVAGALIDLTTREAQSDQLSAYYPGERRYPYRSWSASVTDGGGERAVSAGEASGSAAAVVVTASAAADRPAVEVTYHLDAGATRLVVVTKYTNMGGTPLEVPLADDLRADGQKEDMLKSPNGTAGLFFVEDRYWQQSYGLAARDHEILSNSDARRSALKYVDADGHDTVKLEPGQTMELTRFVAPGRNLLEVRAILAEPQAGKRVTLVVRNRADRPVRDARIEIGSGESTLGTATTDARGETTIPLTPGQYTARASLLGQIRLDNHTFEVHDALEQRESLRLEGDPTGRVVANITDEQGRPIPCKVEFIPRADVPRPDFGPETGEFGVRNLRYAPLGRFEQDLFPGPYRAIVSHGPEYDAVFADINVESGEATQLNAALVRSVDTAGWISSDFHSHSSPSGDNTSSQLGRVLNLVCENVEFAPCTEHNRVSTYVPHIERLGVERFIATCSGMELTGSPLPLNHQNAFPLHHHPHVQDGGGPTTDGDVETQIERLALWDDRSDKLVQQDHPDIGWLFYDRNGDGEPDSGHARGIGLIDVMEIHPLAQALDLQPIASAGGNQWNNRVFNWLQLLNQGYRIPAVANTDSHYNYHGSGWLRIWIESPTDDPSQIKTLDVVHAAEEGRVLMSNGPFLTVRATEAGSTAAPVTMGQDLAAPSGKVRLDVRVQCANWLDVERVLVLANGRVLEQHGYRRKTHPDLFGGGVVKFDRSIELELASDAHLVVITGHPGRTLEPVYGDIYAGQPPVAISNPIFVDVDGGGFAPNKDTLDHPLPVKFPR